MTKINFKRTGGVLGYKLDTEIDLNELPEVESRELQDLLFQTNFFKIPQNLINRAEPDEYEYTVTVEAGNTHHTIHTSDANAPESLRPLLEKLSSLAKESSEGDSGHVKHFTCTPGSAFGEQIATNTSQKTLLHCPNN